MPPSRIRLCERGYSFMRIYIPSYGRDKVAALIISTLILMLRHDDDQDF